MYNWHNLYTNDHKKKNIPLFLKKPTIIYYHLPWIAANFIRFCFCLWLQNHTRTTFFLSSSFSAIWAIFSPEGRGWTVKNASRDRFSGAAIEVRFRFRSWSLWLALPLLLLLLLFMSILAVLLLGVLLLILFVVCPFEFWFMVTLQLLFIDVKLVELLLVIVDEVLMTSSLLRFILESFSACSNQECKTGFNAIILLWLRVNDSNLQIVP